MEFMRLPSIIPLSILLWAMIACTDFQEEEEPVSFGVDVTQVDFSSSVSSRSVTVTSWTKWDVTILPEWIGLQSINPSSYSPYEWTVSFSASANDEYNREGTISIKSGTDAAEISVTQDGKKGKFIAVESISLSSTELTLTEDENASLTFAVSPANASIKDVSWKSSSSSVATVSETGEVNAISPGTAQITVTTADGGKTASCSVTVKAKVIPVSSVSLNKTSLTMTVGDTETLVSTVLPENATDPSVTWTSGNTSIATVSSTGEISAKAVGLTTVTVKTNDGGKTATCTVTVKPVNVSSVTMNRETLSLILGETVTLTATVLPENAANKSVVWSSSNTTVATVSTSGVVTAKAAGTATITVTATDGGSKATCLLTVTAWIVDGSENGHEYVDLGLPSGVKWATCNVGASTPEEYGNYFAWGETDTKSEYNWENYKFRISGDSDSNVKLSKYVDGYPPLLEYSDDAARANWGGKWRMPRYREIDELRNYCTFTWTTQNGVNGCKVSGRNGRSIFLPAAGSRQDTVLWRDGIQCYYWSAELFSDESTDAWYIRIDSRGDFVRMYLERDIGASIRACF